MGVTLVLPMRNAGRARAAARRYRSRHGNRVPRADRFTVMFAHAVEIR